jgi:hypothetical protein
MELEIELFKCQSEFTSITSSLDDIPLVCWKRNAHSKLITYINLAFETEVLQPLGLSKFDLLYKQDESVFGKEYSEKYLESFNYVLNTGKSITRVEPSIDKDGIIHEWRTTKYPIFKDGRVESVGGISYKID